MKRVFVFTMAFALGAALSSGLSAQQAAKPAPKKSNADADINITSDAFQADLNGKTGTWKGNVMVVQGDMKLRANSVRVTTVNGDADKVMASGNVVVDSPKSGTVTGESGVYDVKPRIVTMNGNVVLKKDKNVMRGAQLTVNLATGNATVGGGVKSQGNPTGRVQSVFRPNSGGGNTQ